MLVAALVIAASASSVAASCRHLQPQDIQRSAESVESSTTFQARLDAVGGLMERWRATCKDERAAAPKEIIVKLARLLKIRDIRFAVSSELADVGPNLVAAKPYVDAAVAEEKLRYDELVKKEPVVFNARIHYDAVLCVQHKIRTGTLNSRRCFGILSAKGD
jgi:hypothetical protein